MKENIVITESNYTHLCGLVNNEKISKTTDLKNLDFLGSEIKRAHRVVPEKIAHDCITMNSRIEIADMDTGQLMTVTLVYPRDADFRKGNISVLSPLGAALLGYHVGSIISFEVPKGTKRMQVRNILYQPEANGEFTS